MYLYFFAAASLLFCSFFKMFFVLYNNYYYYYAIFYIVSEEFICTKNRINTLDVYVCIALYLHTHQVKYIPVFINPRRACARGLQYLVCLSVCLCVCVRVCVCFPYSGTSRNQAYKQQYQRLQRDTGNIKRDFSLKRFVPKLWRRLLTSSSSGVVSGILVPFFRRN